MTYDRSFALSGSEAEAVFVHSQGRRIAEEEESGFRRESSAYSFHIVLKIY